MYTHRHEACTHWAHRKVSRENYVRFLGYFLHLPLDFFLQFPALTFH